MIPESLPFPELTPGRRFDTATAGGFLFRGGRVLLEKRSVRALLSPGLWDTPGGKLQEDEAPEEALCRELREELGIQVLRFRLGTAADEEVPREEGPPLLCRHFEYIVLEWKGEPKPLEGQELSWIPIEQAGNLKEVNPLTARALDIFLHQGWIRT